MLFNFSGQIFVKFLQGNVCQKKKSVRFLPEKFSQSNFLAEMISEIFSARRYLPEIIKNNSSRKFLPEIIKHILLEKLWQKLSARTFLPEIISRKFSARKCLPEIIRLENFYHNSVRKITFVHDSSKSNDLGARNLKRKCTLCLISASANYTLPL